MWPSDVVHGGVAFCKTRIGCTAVVGNACLNWKEEVGEDAPGAVEAEEGGGGKGGVS
jgi:hypothetical protein